MNVERGKDMLEVKFDLAHYQDSFGFRENILIRRNNTNTNANANTNTNADTNTNANANTNTNTNANTDTNKLAQSSGCCDRIMI